MKRLVVRSELVPVLTRDPSRLGTCDPLAVSNLLFRDMPIPFERVDPRGTDVGRVTLLRSVLRSILELPRQDLPPLHGGRLYDMQARLSTVGVADAAAGAAVAEQAEEDQEHEQYERKDPERMSSDEAHSPAR